MKITKNYLKQVIKEELEKMEEAPREPQNPFKVGQIVTFEQGGKQQAGVYMGDNKVRPINFALSSQEANYPAKNIKSTNLEELVGILKGEHKQDKSAEEFHSRYGTSGD
jgi:hypothetical protein